MDRSICEKEDLNQELTSNWSKIWAMTLVGNSWYEWWRKVKLSPIWTNGDQLRTSPHISIIIVVTKVLSQLCRVSPTNFICHCNLSYPMENLQIDTLLYIYSWYFHPCSLWPITFFLRVHQFDRKNFPHLCYCWPPLDMSKPF